MGKHFHLQTHALQQRLEQAEQQSMLSCSFPEFAPPPAREEILVFATQEVFPAQIDAIRIGIGRFFEETRFLPLPIKESSGKLFDRTSGQLYSFADDIVEHSSSEGSIQSQKSLVDRLNFFKTQLRHTGLGVLVFPHVWEDDRSILGQAAYPNIFLSTNTEGFGSLQNDLLQLSAAHEMGHIYGLTSRNFNTHTGKDDPHCGSEDCLMFPTLGRKRVRRIIDQVSWLCSDCHDNIVFIRERLLEEGIEL